MKIIDKNCNKIDIILFKKHLWLLHDFPLFYKISAYVLHLSKNTGST